jgi:hypothetical protein
MNSSFCGFYSSVLRGQIGVWEVRVRVFLMMLVLAVVTVEAGAQGVGEGPIPLRNPAPFNLLFLQFVPETPDTLPRKKASYGLQLDVINNLLIPARSGGSDVIEDNEYQRLTLSYRRGLGRDTEIGAFVPLLWRNGGLMDPILSGWHRLFGIPGNADDNPAGRDAYPKFRSVLRVVDANGNTLVDQGNAFGFGDVSLTLKRGLVRATPRSAVALRFGLKLPTGNPTLLLGSGGFDAGLSLDARYNLGREVVLYGSVGVVAMGAAGRTPNPRKEMVQTFLGMEYRLNSRDRFYLQIDGNSQPVRTGNEFADRWAGTATFGYRRILDAQRSLFVSFTENGDFHNYTLPGLSNIGPDFTVSAGFQWRP